MIKINLLAEGKRPAAVRRARPTAAPTRDWGPLLLLVGFLLGLAVFGGWWWLRHQEYAKNVASIRDKEEEVRKLEEIIKEVEAYKRSRAELERKIEVIRQLQANQRGPVQIMDYISKALPELLWLDRMTLKSNRITVSGRAFNTNAVANFIDNLDDFPEFQEPSLQDMQQQTGGVYRFTINFNFSFPKPAPPETVEAPATGAAGTAPPATGPPTAG
jgi:type IV pilus assembly protein PilN